MIDTKQIQTAVKIATQAGPELKKLKTAAQNIEAMFAKDLIAAMRRGGPKTSFGQSYGGEIYQDMMDEALAKATSQAGNLGIGKMIYNQLSKLIVGQVTAKLTLNQEPATTDVKA